VHVLADHVVGVSGSSTPARSTAWRSESKVDANSNASTRLPTTNLDRRSEARGARAAASGTARLSDPLVGDSPIHSAWAIAAIDFEFASSQGVDRAGVLDPDDPYDVIGQHMHGAAQQILGGPDRPDPPTRAGISVSTGCSTTTTSAAATWPVTRSP